MKHAENTQISSFEQSMIETHHLFETANGKNKFLVAIAL
jgi:hypothetical protein